MWQLGARHRIASEDIVNALVKFRSGTTGVIQASTAVWPGFTERIELHGTKGSAIISGDRLTAWEVMNDDEANATDPAPVRQDAASGASDPMAIRLTSFERQFEDFADAIRLHREPLTSGKAGFAALEAVLSVYAACREGRLVELNS
jgi:UDP-N-acetyl-2-amino-2-deoxyglucuronate dehydrogenase